MFQENKAKRTPMQVVGIVVIFILAILILLTFGIFLVFRDSNNPPKLFGYNVYVVGNDLMEPRIPEGSAVFIQEGTLPDPTKQSVILCRIDEKLYVIGCVGTQTTESGELSYIVRYDNATDDRTWGIPQTDIVGVATNYDTFLGGVIRFASSKLGMMLIVIVPCALVIVYELLMLLLSRRRPSSKRESSSKSRRPTAVEPKEQPIKRVGGGPDDEDITPEREDIHIPIDTAVEEKYVEKQLRRANDKLSSTVSETSGEVRHSEEISLDPIELEPEPQIRKADSLFGDFAAAEPKIEFRTAPQPKPSKKPEPVPKLQPEAQPEPESQPIPEPEPQPKPEEEASSPLGELSASRIDELIKLLEEEKKRLSEK